MKMKVIYLWKTQNSKYFPIKVWLQSNVIVNTDEMGFKIIVIGQKDGHMNKMEQLKDVQKQDPVAPHK